MVGGMGAPSPAPGPFAQRGGQLLEEQRVPAGRLQQPPARWSPGRGLGLGQRVQEGGRVAVGQRLQLEGGRPGRAGGPARPLLQQLGTGDGEQQQGRVPGLGG